MRDRKLKERYDHIVRFIKKYWSYLLPFTFAFFVIPLALILATPILLYAVLSLYFILWWVLNPIVCFIVPLIYGVKNKFTLHQLLIPVFVGLISLLSVLIFAIIAAIAGEEAIPIFVLRYTLPYMFIALLGNMVGFLLNKANP